MPAASPAWEQHWRLFWVIIGKAHRMGMVTGMAGGRLEELQPPRQPATHETTEWGILTGMHGHIGELSTHLMLVYLPSCREHLVGGVGNKVHTVWVQQSSLLSCLFGNEWPRSTEGKKNKGIRGKGNNGITKRLQNSQSRYGIATFVRWVGIRCS